LGILSIEKCVNVHTLFLAKKWPKYALATSLYLAKNNHELITYFWVFYQNLVHYGRFFNQTTAARKNNHVFSVVFKQVNQNP